MPVMFRVSSDHPSDVASMAGDRAARAMTGHLETPSLSSPSALLFTSDQARWAKSEGRGGASESSLSLSTSAFSKEALSEGLRGAAA